VSDLLLGLLSAVLATNSLAAVTNLVADKIGVSLPLINTNDPVAVEYQKLVSFDDDTMRQIETWTDQANAATGDDAATAKVTLNLRIKQNEDNVQKAYEDFIQHHHDYAKARLAYGSFLNEIGDEEGAIAQWEKGRELDPRNPAAWDDCANFYGHRGPVTNAFVDYGKAIELDPSQAVYYQNLAVSVYLFRKDAEDFYHLTEEQVFDKALALYREAIKRAPDDFILASDYAMSFYGTRPPRWEEGLVAWNQALKIAHDDVEREGVYIHLARLSLKLNRFTQAHAWLDKVTNSGYDVLKNRIARNIHETEYPTNSVPFD